MDEQSLASSLRSAVSALHKRLRKQAYSVKSYSMTEIETVGHLLRNDKLLPTELAALARVKTQSMSQILKTMEERGIISRIPSETDKRKVYVAITSYGRDVVDKMRYERDEWLKGAIEATLTKDEQEQLVNILPIFNKLTEAK